MIPQTDFSSNMEILANGNVRYTNAYASYEFQNIPLKKLEDSALAEAKDRFEGPGLPVPNKENRETIQAKQIAMFKRSYMAGSLEWSPKTRDAWRDVSGRADEAIGKYLDGTMSEDELASSFQSLSHEMYEATARVGYPLPFVDETMEQACTEAMYDNFREKILGAAVQRNNAEGRQYVTGEMCPQRTWKYYNADYYYKSEDAIAAVTRGMEEFAQDRGWKWTVPDYRGKNMYYNFNTAFSNNFCLDSQYILDPDMVPPEGFEWFYQTGGSSSSGPVIATPVTIITHADGTEEYVEQGQRTQRTKFDPTDYYTANTWAAYTDKNGQRHVVSKDIIFKGDKSDLFNAGDLLRFAVGDESEALNAFLHNLQLYPKNYFSMYYRPASFDCCI